MKKFGLIDQKYPKITWLGPYNPHRLQQDYPNEFHYGYKVYKIDENGYWSLNQNTVCFGDPFVVNGKLCGKLSEKDLSERMIKFILDDSDNLSDSLEDLEDSDDNIICRFYLNGNCIKGKKCKYKHPGSTKIPCKFYPLKQCKKGLDCPFLH